MSGLSRGRRSQRERHWRHVWSKVLRNATIRAASHARGPAGSLGLFDGRFAGDEERLLAPRAGFEPATIRLTVECSTAELPRNRRNNRSHGQRITKPPGLSKDQMAGVWALFG